MMTKFSPFLIVVSFMAFGISACSQEQKVLNKPPGTYENMESSTDSQGTTTQRSSSTNISVDKQGYKKAIVKSKTTKDPSGLFNKTTTKQSTTKIHENP